MEQYKSLSTGDFFIKKNEVHLIASTDFGSGSVDMLVIYTNSIGIDFAMSKAQFEKLYEKVWDIPEEGDLLISPNYRVCQVSSVSVVKCVPTEITVKACPKGETNTYPSEDVKEYFKPFKPELGQMWLHANQLWEITQVLTHNVVLRQKTTADSKPVSITDLIDSYQYCVR